MPIRAILLDKDGTLVDFQLTWGPATHAVIAHLAAGDDAAYGRLAAVSGFVAAEQRFLVGSPLIGGATPDYGPSWAQALGRNATPDFFAEIDRLFLRAGLEPAPVLAFARTLGIAPGEVAVVGDAVHDLAAARAAGAAAIGVLSGPTPREFLAPHADALIGSVADLPSWLDGR